MPQERQKPDSDPDHMLKAAWGAAERLLSLNASSTEIEKAFKEAQEHFATVGEVSDLTRGQPPESHFKPVDLCALNTPLRLIGSRQATPRKDEGEEQRHFMRTTCCTRFS